MGGQQISKVLQGKAFVPPALTDRSLGKGFETGISTLGCIALGYRPRDSFTIRVGRSTFTRRANGPGQTERFCMQATDILQRYLDDMGKAVMTERLDLYLAGVGLPLNIITSTANLTVETVDDLVDGFDDFCEMIHSQGVSDMVRIVMEARFETVDRIVGIYETNLLDGERHVVPPFFSKIWLQRTEGVWQSSKIHNTTYNSRWPIPLYQVEAAHWPPKESLE
jgi:hypothetical protein